MKVVLETVDSEKGTATFTEDGEVWEAILVSNKTGDSFTLKATNKRRARNKYVQFKRWLLGGLCDE